jgi:hypothetical protein
MKHLTTIFCILLVSCATTRLSTAQTWNWEDPKITIDATGDLEWSPLPFAFPGGESLRYIDFADGDDANDGRTRQSPWKHHPWDPQATGNAAACRGIHTYVFKRGVDYRGQLLATESGKPELPIRLTSDPDWGQGDAVLCGSEQITGWTLGAGHADIPEPSKVAFVDLDFAPRRVWYVEDEGATIRLALARTPNWSVSDPDDIKSEWWTWKNPDNPWGSRVTLNGTQSHFGCDPENLTQPAEYYEGAYIWPEYGWVMSTPYPTRVLRYDAQRRGLVFGGQWSNNAGSYHVPRHARYYLEDKPHYLDEGGEFWFQKKGRGGRLFLRLPGDRDPNQAHLEVARRINLIDSEGMNHVHMTGLAFRFTNVFWDLDAPPMRHVDVDPACVRLLGSGTDVQVSNCKFEHVHLPIRIKAVGDEAAVDQIVIRDNVFQFTDHGAVSLADGGAWGTEDPRGRLYDARVLRNRMFQIGRRPSRFGQGHAIEIDCAETLEVAGNVGHRLYGSGIFVFGGKRSAAKVDRPLTRILIHHNKIVDALLNNNDWGGIETWQGGPAYVFNNLSRNPRGYKHWGYKLQADRPSTSSFGHAYYMDGGYKQYYFNNIAWGNSNDPFGPLGNCAAFQEIHGFLASLFNNTAYNFVIGSRRQAPEAGRNKYLGNIWHSMGEMVFRHARPTDMMADPNVADAGDAESEFHHESNAYANNVFYNLPAKVAVFEPDGRWHASVDSFRAALRRRHSLGAAGQAVDESPLADPEGGDFRPTKSARDQGVRVFVPWGLYATVGEWPFYAAGDDPAHLLDEHFHLAPYYVNREDYKRQPMYPLRGVNIGANDYVEGPLEDWIRGALRLNGRNQYAVLPNDSLQTSVATDDLEITRKEYDWIKVDAPERVAIDQQFEARLHLDPLAEAVKPGMKLRADLHWTRANGSFGGTNVWGGEAQQVDGRGPYVFRFKPQSKPGLRNFTLTAWLTPTGEWADQTEVAQFMIGKLASTTASDYRSPQVQRTNFLLEVYFRTSPGHVGGVLMEKMQEAGYSLSVNAQGGVGFAVRGEGAGEGIASQATVNDGQWHHVVAEADRDAATVKLYLDGKLAATGAGVNARVSLANQADFFVGGTPQGRCLDGTLEFARIAHGTLADAKTTIDELYAWQFSGPFLRDWSGRMSVPGERDAGAIDGQ